MTLRSFLVAVLLFAAPQGLALTSSPSLGPRVAADELAGRTGPDGRAVPPLDAWTTVPEFGPVWVLEVKGDSARVITNEFQGGPGGAGETGQFPVESVQLVKEWFKDHGGGRWRFFSPHVQKPVKSDGTLMDEEIEWLEDMGAVPRGRNVRRSRWGRFTVFIAPEEMVLVSDEGDTIGRINQETVWANCHDPSRRILAVAREEVSVGDYKKSLQRLLIVDYAGNVVHRGGLMDCEVNSGALSRDGETVVFWLTGCQDDGEYILRLRDGKDYSLSNLPEGAHRFSPDYEHVLVNKDGGVAVYSVRNPDSPVFMWRVTIAGGVRDIAISDEAEFVAYRVRGPRGDLPYIYVLSGADGTALCRLKTDPERLATEPLVFVDRFLFVGAYFGGTGSGYTDHIYVFDLGSVPSEGD